MCRPEKRGRVIFAFLDDAVGRVQHVGAADFGDVERFASEKGNALMPRHMEAYRFPGFVCGDVIYDRGVHSSSFSATCIMTAHSMRFLKSSQP